MGKKIFQFLILMLCATATATAQYLTPQQYVEKYKDLAIKEMKRMGIPAAITLAQGLLETENGNSDLVKKSNNHFGIKCKSSWTSEGVSHDDDAPGECFRKYKDADASYRDHSNYLRGNDRYASLFSLNPADYKAWARGLRQAGYATNPKYPDILIRNIEQYNLQQYSLEAANDVPKIDLAKYADDKEPAVASDRNENPSPEITHTKPPEQNESRNTINGHKYIIAKKGTSLLAIATENDIDLSKLLAFNDLENDGILQEDQIVFLQKKSKVGDKDYYIVQPQENLYEVAQKNGIQIKYLLAYNQLGDNAVITGGKKLFLNSTAQIPQVNNISNVVQPAIIKQQNAATNKDQQKPNILKPQPLVTMPKNILPNVAGTRIHEVQAKEGLYGIAKKYQVTVQQLREWNNLTNDDIKIGQQIIVSK